MIEPNKIDFMGHPIAYGAWAKGAAFFRRTDVITTGLAVAFSAAAAEVAMPSGFIAGLAVGQTLLLNTASSWFTNEFSRNILALSFGQENLTSKIINKKT